jgi:hypothetical protein
MLRRPVNSSVIASIGYSSADERLEVEFHNGRVYEYRGVPAAAYDALMSANSIGACFNKTIRDRYRSRQVSSSGTAI